MRTDLILQIAAREETVPFNKLDFYTDCYKDPMILALLANVLTKTFLTVAP